MWCVFVQQAYGQTAAPPPSTSKAGPTAVASPSAQAVTQPSADEKIGRMDGRIDELAKRVEASNQAVSSTAQYAMDVMRNQLTILTWAAGIFMTILTGGGIAGLVYVYKTYKKIEERTGQTITRLEQQCNVSTENVARELNTFRNEIAPMQQDQSANIHFVLGWIACQEWRLFKSPAIANRAIMHCDIGLKSNPANLTIKAQLYAWKAWALKRVGRFIEAADEMKKAREILPDNVTYTYNHACYTKLAGNLRDSLRLLAEAIQKDAAYKQHAASDDDWKDVLDNPEFKALVA